MVISKLGEMAGDWECPWDFRDTFDVRDIGTSEQLWTLAWVLRVFGKILTLYNKKANAVVIENATT